MLFVVTDVVTGNVASLLEMFLTCLAVEASVLLSHQWGRGQRGSRGLWEDGGGIFSEERGGLLGQSSPTVSGETTHRFMSSLSFIAMAASSPPPPPPPPAGEASESEAHRVSGVEARRQRGGDLRWLQLQSEGVQWAAAASQRSRQHHLLQHAGARVVRRGRYEHLSSVSCRHFSLTSTKTDDLTHQIVLTKFTNSLLQVVVSNRLCSIRRRWCSVVPHENLRVGSVFSPSADVRIGAGRRPPSEFPPFKCLRHVSPFKVDVFCFCPPGGSRAQTYYQLLTARRF